MEVLNKKAREFSMKGEASFKKSLEILSIPKLFAVLILANAALISLTSIVLKLNLALFALTSYSPVRWFSRVK